MKLLMSSGNSLRIAMFTAILALLAIAVASVGLQIGTITLDIFVYLIVIPVLIIIATVPILQIYLFRAVHKDLTPDVEWAGVENSYRTTLATIIGGGAILSTIVFSWYNFSNTRQSTTAERFAKAIEFLAKKETDDEVKNATPLLHVAGLYVIQEIANSDILYRERSLNIIRSFIAGISPRYENEFCSQLQISGRTVVNPTRGQSPGDDIQTALGILGKGFPSYLSGKQPVVDLSRLDLCFAYLPNSYLPNLYAEGSDFRRSRFEGSDLSNANIRGADFTLSNLSKVNFRDADLRCSIFSNADLSNAIINNADFNCADLTGVDLSKTIGVEKAILDGACLDMEPGLPRNWSNERSANCKWRGQDPFDNDGEECQVKCTYARGEPRSRSVANAGSRR